MFQKSIVRSSIPIVKRQVKGMFLLLLIPVFTTSCDLLNKEDGVVPVQTVQDYSARIADLHDALENFVLKDQAFENAQFSTLKSIQSKQIVGDYLDAGSTLVGVMQKIQIIQNQTKSLQLKSGSTPTPRWTRRSGSTINPSVPGVVKSKSLPGPWTSAPPTAR